MMHGLMNRSRPGGTALATLQANAQAGRFVQALTFYFYGLERKGELSNSLLLSESGYLKCYEL